MRVHRALDTRLDNEQIIGRDIEGLPLLQSPLLLPLARLREQEDRQTYLAQLGTVLAVAAQAQDDNDAVRARNVLEDEVWLYRELRKVRRRTA